MKATEKTVKSFDEMVDQLKTEVNKLGQQRYLARMKRSHDKDASIDDEMNECYWGISRIQCILKSFEDEMEDIEFGEDFLK
jgi:predicted RNase H-like nuclease (RuvC/YqgF family)